MSSSGQDLRRFKPPEMDEEEWEETLEELEDRKVDNSNHQTVQLKVKRTIKYLSPFVILPLLALAGFLAFKYQAILFTIIAIIITLLFIYYASVEEFAGDQS